jgi:hypothetical protein
MRVANLHHSRKEGAFHEPIYRDGDSGVVCVCADCLFSILGTQVATS